VKYKKLPVELHPHLHYEFLEPHKQPGETLYYFAALQKPLSLFGCA
jgi:hypothetical protein